MRLSFDLLLLIFLGELLLELAPLSPPLQFPLSWPRLFLSEEAGYLEEKEVVVSE